LRNNLLARGSATIHFGLARRIAPRSIYDVGGRLVRTPSTGASTPARTT
jgi:hypothetical protein